MLRALRAWGAIGGMWPDARRGSNASSGNAQAGTRRLRARELAPAPPVEARVRLARQQVATQPGTEPNNNDEARRPTLPEHRAWPSRRRPRSGATGSRKRPTPARHPIPARLQGCSPKCRWQHREPTVVAGQDRAKVRRRGKVRRRSNAKVRASLGARAAAGRRVASAADSARG